MYVVGVDESGTGAWAGPFFVSAVAVEIEPFNRAIGRYLRDSKALSDTKRRLAAPVIRRHAIICSVIEVSVRRINAGPYKAWRWAIYKALEEAFSRVDQSTLTIIDGRADAYPYLQKQLTNKKYNFVLMPQADTRIPAVMAASIIAKTARNDAMIALSAEYPEFGWERNAGYGTKEHHAACDKYGVTQYHRKIRPLKFHADYQPTGDWHRQEGA